MKNPNYIEKYVTFFFDGKSWQFQTWDSPPVGNAYKLRILIPEDENTTIRAEIEQVERQE